MFPHGGTKRKRDHEESDSEEDVLPGKQILPVANLPLDFDGEPMDGAQYLFTVRRDAKKLPHVTRVENPYALEEAIVPQSNDEPPKSAALPSAEWRETFDLHFKCLRQNLAQPTIHVNIPRPDMMPPKKERDLWWAFLAGRPEADWKPVRARKQSKNKSMRSFSPEPELEEEPQEDYEEVWKVNDDGEVELTTPSQPVTKPLPKSSEHASTYTPREPTPSLIKQIDHKMALHLLMYFTHWISLHLRQPQLSNIASPSGLSESHARWILSLLTRVDDYVSADEMHLLRGLARACVDAVKEFRRVSRPQTAEVSESMSERSFWMVFTLVADYWTQRDLWMDVETALVGL